MRIAGTSLKPLEFWRDDVDPQQTANFASSLLVTALRMGSGARVGELGPRPTDALILYQIETCPFSRLVREALSELDLDALIKPCPRGEEVHRRELESHAGQVKLPFLIDRSVRVELGESADIVAHLYKHYGKGAPPVRLRGPLALASSKLASHVRGERSQYQAPSRRPELTLELWNYEGSPYCRLAREQLDRFGLPYVSRNLARKSPRRPEFRTRFGVMQFPRLYDPNTKIGLFETDAIVSYLSAHYGNSFVAVGEEVGAHPA
jgi:glutathione S-transferase